MRLHRKGGGGEMTLTSGQRTSGFSHVGKNFEWPVSFSIEYIKGHDNEADFLGFLQKLVPHRSLTLPFQPF
jgi:hypothetical protein